MPPGRTFSVEQLRARWGAPPARGAAPEVEALSLLLQLREAIARELGPRAAPLQPFLDEARAQIDALFPGGAALPEALFAERSAVLAGLLDQIEDIMEALARLPGGG